MCQVYVLSSFFFLYSSSLSVLLWMPFAVISIAARVSFLQTELIWHTASWGNLIRFRRVSVHTSDTLWFAQLCPSQPSLFPHSLTCHSNWSCPFWGNILANSRDLSVSVCVLCAAVKDNLTLQIARPLKQHSNTATQTTTMPTTITNSNNNKNNSNNKLNNRQKPMTKSAWKSICLLSSW